VREAIFENAQGLGSVELRDERVRERSEGGVQLRNEINRVELAQEIVGSVIGEAHIGGEEFLVQNGSAQKVSHLLFLDRFTRERQSVAAAGEDEAGDAAVHGSQKSKFAFFKIDFHVAATELDAVGGRELVGGRRIETQGVDGVVEFVGRLIGGGGYGQRNETPQD